MPTDKRSDKERMDWLEEHQPALLHDEVGWMVTVEYSQTICDREHFEADTLREAIDKAMEVRGE